MPEIRQENCGTYKKSCMVYDKAYGNIAKIIDDAFEKRAELSPHTAPA